MSLNAGALVPLISSGCAGPLGLLHLPRLRWTTSLRAAGRLTENEAAADAAWDAGLCAAVGLDRVATRWVWIATCSTAGCANTGRRTLQSKRTCANARRIVVNTNLSSGVIVIQHSAAGLPRRVSALITGPVDTWPRGHGHGG